jgi:putative peptidoglycan lipid II flippase
LLAIGLIASRALGLVRNIVLAQQFGTDRDYEAFLAAVEIPDLVFQVLAGGAVGSAFIPVFQTYVTGGHLDAAWRMTRTLMTIGALATGAIAALLAVFAHQVADAILPGWDGADQAVAADLMRIMLVSPALFAVSCFATSALNSFNRFAVTMLAPILYNLAIILGALALTPLGIRGVAFGVAAGAALHLLVQVPSLVRCGMPLAPRLDIGSEGVRRVVQLMLPRMLGLALVQLNQLANVVLSTFLVVGSLAYLKVAWLMILTPLVLAMAVSTAVFPTLAAESARDRVDAVRALFAQSLRNILFLTVPMAAGLVILREPLIGLLFERGEFDATSTAHTAAALGLYAIGLCGLATTEIADRVFYALQDTRTPVAAAAVGFVLSLGLGVVLMNTPLNYSGLALAGGIAALVEACLLLLLLSRRLAPLDLGSVARSFARAVLATSLMSAAIIALPTLLSDALDASPPVERLVVVATVVTFGAAVYAATSLAIGSTEARSLVAFAKRR